MCKRFVCASLLLLSFGLAQAKEIVWQKAAYWDSRYPTGWVAAADTIVVRDALKAAGYTILNADELKTWMNARIADKSFSVVVFCRDIVPDTVAETQSATCTLRRYLDAGGKIVFFGDIPFYNQGHADNTNTNWANAGAPGVLGFDTSSAPRDSGNTSTITPLGTAWGLTATWTTQRPAAPSVTALDILAKDNAGNAAAWVKHYVPNDTFRGFVRLRDTGGQPVIADVIRLAEYVSVKASSPQPASGATGVTMALMQWASGPFAMWHDVFFGTNPNPGPAEHVAKQFAAMTMYFHPAGLQPGTTYYWRVDEIEADGTVYTGDVWSFTASPNTAWTPSPGDGASYIAQNATLNWTPGMGAMGHDVYFGADRAAVESGAAAVKVATKQPATTYTPAGLERGKTYYWRVDESTVSGMVPGAVWSFTVRPVLAKVDASLVGWWKMEDEKSGSAVDYSGYDNYGTLVNGPQFVEGYLGDALSFDGTDDYVNCGSDASLTKVDSVSVTAWVKLASVGADRKIASNQSGAGGGYKLGVYNSNNMLEFEIRNAANAATLNRNAPGGTALQADTWYHVVGVYEKGKALRTYINGKLDREQATAEVLGVSTGALMLGREAPAGANWWRGLMDDVRVYNKALTEEEIQKAMRGDPLLAWGAQPVTGASVDIRDAVEVQWSAGEQAAQHDVYLGQDRDALKTANTTSPLYRGRQAGTSFDLADLVQFGGGAYFWRIDEVEADGTTLHKGPIWSFTVPGYLIVDEFESYNDTDNRIYDSWLDNFGDDSGSIVGNDPAPFAERTVIHGGRQSLPLAYNNAGPKHLYSETERTFDTLQNWTGFGVTDLSLWFRGNPVGFADNGNNAFTVSGGGNDIWNAADAFRFAYKKLSGNGSITARVDAQTNTNGWAKAGVMIRETLDAGSAHAAVVVTPSNGVSFPYRATVGGASAQANIGAVQVPYWIRLTRTGNIFKAEYSLDNKAWTPVSADVTINMGTNVYVGLAVTSHNVAAVSTAQFSNVAITGGVSGLWQAQGIGTDPQPANDPDKLYVAIEDSSSKVVVVTHPDPAATVTAAWTQWKIPLSSLTGVNLAKVKTMYLGVGDRKAPVLGGTGRIFIDDIQVIKQ